MKIVVEISDADAKHIKRAIELANSSDANTHGTLDFETLARMLFGDVALAVRRPGSGEGANMAQVLASHGYELGEHLSKEADHARTELTAAEKLLCSVDLKSTQDAAAVINEVCESSRYSEGSLEEWEWNALRRATKFLNRANSTEVVAAGRSRSDRNR